MMKEKRDKESRTLFQQCLPLWILGVYLPFIVFVLLSGGVTVSGSFIGDEAVLHFIHRFASPQVDSWIIAMTHLGSFRVILSITLIVALILACRRRMREARFLLLAQGGAAVLSVVLKVLFQRARPSLWQSPAPEWFYGFPSAHSLLSLALVLGLIVLWWPTRGRWLMLIVGILLAIAVGFSRLYLGVHYPSDVLAGWSIATAWIFGLTLYLGDRKFTQLPQNI